MKARTHPVFKLAPPAGTIALSTGSAPTPYFVYDGHGTLVIGTCEADALTEAFAGQSVHPVLTASGQGVLVMFICSFTDASHGPHLEFHVTALAAPAAGVSLSDDPAEALTALALRPDWGVFSLHLWNDTPEVVAYNREYLGLNAALCGGEVSVSSSKVTFAFETPDGGLLAKGSLQSGKSSTPALAWRVMRHLGVRGMWQAMRRQPARAHVINPIGAAIPRNGRALTLTAPDKMVMRAFDKTRDSFDGAAPHLAAYGFAPQIIEHVWPFRFVYVHPDDV